MRETKSRNACSRTVSSREEYILKSMAMVSKLVRARVNASSPASVAQRLPLFFFVVIGDKNACEMGVNTPTKISRASDLFSFVSASHVARTSQGATLNATSSASSAARATRRMVSRIKSGTPRAAPTATSPSPSPSPSPPPLPSPLTVRAFLAVSRRPGAESVRTLGIARAYIGCKINPRITPSHASRNARRLLCPSHAAHIAHTRHINSKLTPTGAGLFGCAAVALAAPAHAAAAVAHNPRSSAACAMSTHTSHDA